MTKEKFEQLAAYNRWANARLYAAALGLSDQSYRLHVGVFFGSLHGTLNHLLLTDRLWLKRLTGEGEHPNRLDAILFEDRSELTRARIAEDARLIQVVESYDGTALANLHGYKTSSGMPQYRAIQADDRGDVLPCQKRRNKDSTRFGIQSRTSLMLDVQRESREPRPGREEIARS
jgi:uncharacterized damage-inducible protein DinB